MTIDDMITLVCHAEYCANSRPLTFVTQNDQQHILTPNLMIFGRQMHTENWLDNDKFSDPDFTLISQNQLGEAFKKLRSAMSEIENDFNTMYLDQLRERDAKQMNNKNNKK